MRSRTCPRTALIVAQTRQGSNTAYRQVVDAILLTNVEERTNVWMTEEKLAAYLVPDTTLYVLLKLFRVLVTVNVPSV